MHHGVIEDPEPPAFIACDPRFVIVVFALIVAVTFIVRSTTGLVIILGYVLLLQRLARMSARLVIRRTRTVTSFVVLAVVLNAFLIKGTPLPQPFSFLSREGMARGVFYGLRVLTIYYVLMVFVALNSQETIARGLAAMLRPFSKPLAARAALHAFLTVGFLPLFAEEIERIRVAQRFRGGGMQGRFRERISSVRLLFVPLVISAIRRSGQLAMAVEIRGIRTSIFRLLAIPRPASRDVIFAAVTVAVLLGAGWIG